MLEQESGEPGAQPRTGPDSGPSANVGAAFCDRCGEPVETGSHARCQAARRLEPPRYCTHCRRRMVVQVTPAGWSARCVEHGELAGH